MSLCVNGRGHLDRFAMFYSVLISDCNLADLLVLLTSYRLKESQFVSLSVIMLQNSISYHRYPSPRINNRAVKRRILVGSPFFMSGSNCSSAGNSFAEFTCLFECVGILSRNPTFIMQLTHHHDFQYAKRYCRRRLLIS